MNSLGPMRETRMTNDMDDPAVVRGYLETWAGVDVTGIRRLPGHSGITYGFGAGTDELVVELRPTGVRANAGNDIAGQGRMPGWVEAGRRPDPTWEVPGEAFGHLVARAHVLLDDDS